MVLDQRMKSDKPHPCNSDVVSLNLSGNLLCCWEDVASITKQLEGLQELQLSDNRLCIPADPQNLAHAFINLRVLALNSTAVICGRKQTEVPICPSTHVISIQVLRCAPMWPLLEELYVCENEITELHRPKNVLQNLKVLDLSKNSLAGGNELLNIAELPRLEKLNLSSTGLSTLQFNDVGPGCKTAMFPALKFMSLDDNAISEWSVVNELEKLASLQQLSCHRNPLIEQDRTPETTRQLFIARIGQLQVLNKSEVMREERKGAELDYCKMFCVMWLGSGGNRDPELDRPSGEFVEQHPRFQSLIRSEQSTHGLRAQTVIVRAGTPAVNKPSEEQRSQALDSFLLDQGWETYW
ncbi:hypothetical protein Z043_104320 [Scleropages formosus]|uniref:Tubulin-specific chaperone E-like n=1 Tax=Scleropages formosus TaxID=113540 RepID=A0A0P7VKJ0_SCLFO|nr:hypothetical protein Z043_104320 [Scleropages formosus]